MDERREKAIEKYKRFENLLNERNINSATVCREAYVDFTTLSHWKRGDYVPKAETLLKIARYFEVDVAYFIE